MLVYTFDHTLDGVLSAVFDAYFRHQSPDMLIGDGDQLPLFCDEVWEVITTDEKATRVWKGMEKHMSREALRLISISWCQKRKSSALPYSIIYIRYSSRQAATNAASSATFQTRTCFTSPTQHGVWLTNSCA